MTVEAILLLCFNRGADASPPPPPPKPPFVDPRTFTLPDEAPVDVTTSSDDNSGPSKPQPQRPVIDEPPPASDNGKIAIDTPPVGVPSTIPVDRIPPGVIYAGNGEPGIGGGISDARLLDNAPQLRVQQRPRYPYDAKHNLRTGEVVVEFVVNYDGRVLNPRVVSSSDSLFEEATLQAVSQWRFEPGRRDGKVVRFRMMVPVEFRLDGE